MKRLVLVLFLLACAVTPFGQSPLGQSPLPTQQKPKGDCYAFPNGSRSCGAWGSVIRYDGGPSTLSYEPPDVPAIEEKVKTGGLGNCQAAPQCVGKGMGCNLMVCEDRTVPVSVWTCADKERILETSESGKHWCRKVQN